MAVKQKRGSPQKPAKSIHNSIRVTLIDSQMQEMDILHQALKTHGYATSFIHDSSEALVQLSNADILLMDISVARQPKSSKYIRVPALVVLTHNLDDGLPPWLQAQHVFLRQYPQNPDELINRLSGYLPKPVPNFEVTSHKTEHLALLFGITQFLSGHLDITDLFERVLELPAYLDADFGALLVQEGTETICYRSTQPGREELTGAAGHRFARRLIEDGVEGWVLQQGQPAVVANTTEDARCLRASYLPDEPHCIIVLPIHLQRIEARGVFLLGHKQPGFFSAEHLPLLEAATTQIGMALENAILFKNQAQRSVQLALINEVSQAATSILNLDVMLRTVVQAIRRSFAFHNVAIYLLSHDTNLVELHAQSPAVRQGGAIPLNSDNNRAFQLRRGLVGWSAATKSTVLSNDVTLDPRYIPGQTDKEIRAKLCVPIVLGTKTIGVLELQSTRIDAFDRYHVDALETLADQLAIAIENARLYDEINQHIQELKSLNEIGQTITSTLDFRKTLTMITDRTTRLMDVAAASVVLRDEKQGDIWFAAASGEGSEAVIGKRMARGKGIAGWVTNQGESVIVPDVNSDNRFFADMDKQSGFITKSIICVPLQTRGYTIGAIEVMNKKRGTFNQDDLSLLQALASPAATAIENAQLFEQADSLSVFNEDIIQNMTNGLIAIDKRGHITAFNPAASKMLGYQPEQMLNHTLAETLHGADPLIEMFNSTLNSGRACPRKEITAHHSDGHQMPVSVSTAVLGTDNGSHSPIGVVGVMEDLSEIKALEAEYRRLDRLAVLGEMSAVVAHEIRNPIAGIAVGVEYLTRNVPEDSAESQGVALIRGEIQRVNHILEDILFIARPLKLEPGTHQLPPIITVVLRRRQAEIEENGITVSSHYQDNLPSLYVDNRRLEQVFANLIINAIQAMPDGGELTLSAQLSASPSTKMQYIEITISDTGQGISDEARQRIFDPFFTTKSKGTGLGLSVARGIIEAHRGTLHLHSEPGKGTCFTLTLPVSKETIS